ncbi:hypothetical protein VFC49_10310 [Thermococcus sp. SY098]|uniref:hypothetical protein n=1 Tax=Thermococcus sp. SY098 TaxID=3111325 RepID=UPI002D78362D|nr:hypothetical protein [Thermococcus sp. SY098]WRS52410.1 hypothetical protein VFC49_10310 [Thermococcus sp. SY098]
MYESDYDPAYLLSRLRKDELFEVCETYFDIYLPKSVTKQELIERILAELSLLREGYSEKQEPKRKKEAVYEKTKSMSTIEREVYNALREFKPYKVENEKDLEKQLVVHLRSKVSSKVTPQKAGAWHGNIYTPDIVVENIAVEVKFFNKGKRRDEWVELLVRLLDTVSRVGMIR